MSRMTTSLASLSWARPAIRRACSSGVSRSDLRVDGRGHEPVDRLAPSNALPDLLRGDGHRLDLEEEDPLGAGKAGEDVVELPPGIAGTARDAQPRELEDRVRLLPLREVGELVGADQKDGVVPAPLAEHVDGACVAVELDLPPGKRSPRQLEASVGGTVNGLVPRLGDDDHDEPVEPQLPDGCVSERDVSDVRGVERAPEQAGHGRQPSTSVSSPTSTSLPFRAPAARSAPSSSSAGGGSPSTRKPRSVRRIRYATARGCGR